LVEEILRIAWLEGYITGFGILTLVSYTHASAEAVLAKRL
jgi:hypothetical protein